MVLQDFVRVSNCKVVIYMCFHGGESACNVVHGDFYW